MDSPHKEKGLILALLESSSDSETAVRKTISTSLIQLGKFHPSLVLSSIRKFLDNTQTAPKAHIQTVLYNTVESIIREGVDAIDENIIEDWVKASEQLLIQAAIAHDLQQAVSNLLVALACTKKYSFLVLSTLISLLKPEEVPSQAIVETLGSVATSNSRGSAIFFNQVLSNLSHYLVNVKQDGLRLSVASTLGKFSEGVVDAVANRVETDTLTLEEHHDHCSTVFDILVHHWLKTSNAGVKNEVILCLGHMSYLLPKGNLELYAPSLVSSIISHYKRNPNPFTITFSLALIFDALFKMSIENCLRVHIDLMLNTLFSQVCVIPNFNEPHTVKNHCEVLRCFDMLAKSFPEPVILLLLQRLENASHIQRVGSLLVLKHLINSRSISVDNINRLVSVLNVPLCDPNSKVVRNVAQVIVALCHNGHLDETSGAPFISYLVSHSAGGTLDSRRSSLNEVGEEFVGNICCRALNLLATSVSSAVPLLWPQLLRYLTNLEYQNSFPTILSCLASILANSNASPDSFKETPFTESGPTSAAYVFTHLLLLCCSPKASMALPALSVLQGLAPHISPSLPDLWSAHLPQLKETYSSLSSSSGNPSSLQMWQDSLRDFLSCSIEAIGNDSFTCNIISSQMEQLEVWEKNQAYRPFLMSAVGVSLKHCSNESLIHSTLESLYSITNHRSYIEQESFSLSVGMCSVTHMSAVLSHFETWLKNTDVVKRGTLSLFYLLKSQDGRSEEAQWIRSTLVLCLGQMARLAPPEVVGNYVDGPIMLHLLNIINCNKSDLVNDVILQTLSKIAKSLLCLPAFRLRQRPLFLTHIVNTLKQETLTLHSLTGALQVLRDLAALQPELNIEERTIVLQASLTSTYSHLQSASGVDSFLDRCYSQLNVLIRTIIQHDTCPATLDDVTTLLHPWTLSSSEVVRVKAMDLLYSSFCTFLQHLVITFSGPSSFSQTCQLLAMLTPRFSDPCKEVRSQAVACLTLVLKILGRYNGHGPDHIDDDINVLKGLEEKILDAETTQTSVCQDAIAKVLCNKLNFVQLRMYISLVVIGLQDLQSESSFGVSQILGAIFSLRGHQFHQHIKEILDSIYHRLEKVVDVKTRRGSVEAICNLSKHNLVAIIDAIMTYPVPYDKSICEIIQRIGCEGDLCAASLTHLTHILERTQLYTEHQTASDECVRIATLSTLTSICTMKELLYLVKPQRSLEKESSSPPVDGEEEGMVDVVVVDAAASRQIVNERLPSLVALLILSYGSYIDTMAPLHQSMAEVSRNSFVPNRNATGIVPSKCALECLQALISISGCSQLEEALSSELLNPNGDTLEDFLHSLSTIVLLLAQEAPGHISSLVAYLDTHHNHEIQRIAVTAVFGELVAEKCCGDFELLEIVTAGLLTRLNDKSSQVRRLAVKGLANFAHVQKEQLCDKMSDVVNALVGATDLREGSEAEMECQVTLEAMRGLASLLPHLSPSFVIQHTPTLLIRIRLFVEKNSGEVREASMGVLRGLSVSVGYSEEFREHIHLHLLTAIIHLEDPYPSMAVMCKSALQSLGPHIASMDIQKLFQEKLVPSAALNFQEFIGTLSEMLVSEMSDQLPLFLQVSSSYFRHSEPSIRRASILLTGHLIYHSSESASSPCLQRVYHGIIYLLRDMDPIVRSSAASVVPLVAKHEKIL